MKSHTQFTCVIYILQEVLKNVNFTSLIANSPNVWAYAVWNPCWLIFPVNPSVQYRHSASWPEKWFRILQVQKSRLQIWVVGEGGGEVRELNKVFNRWCWQNLRKFNTGKGIFRTVGIMWINWWKKEYLCLEVSHKCKSGFSASIEAKLPWLSSLFTEELQ